MKKVSVWLVILAFTFALGIASTFLWLKYNSAIPADVNKPEELPILAYCELIKNPDKYSGKTVRINTVLRWNMHGYFLADENCFGKDINGVTAITYNRENSEEIEKKINMVTGKEKVSYNNWLNMLVTGRFERVEKCRICTDSMLDRTTLRFEIIEVETGHLIKRN